MSLEKVEKRIVNKLILLLTINCRIKSTKKIIDEIEILKLKLGINKSIQELEIYYCEKINKRYVGFFEKDIKVIYINNLKDIIEAEKEGTVFHDIRKSMNIYETIGIENSNSVSEDELIEIWLEKYLDDKNLV